MPPILQPDQPDVYASDVCPTWEQIKAIPERGMIFVRERPDILARFDDGDQEGIVRIVRPCYAGCSDPLFVWVMRLDGSPDQYRVEREHLRIDAETAEHLDRAINVIQNFGLLKRQQNTGRNIYNGQFTREA